MKECCAKPVLEDGRARRRRSRRGDEFDVKKFDLFETVAMVLTVVMLVACGVGLV
jgi:hypothetical protein